MDAENLTFSRWLKQASVLAAIMLTSLGLYLVILKWRGPAAQIPTYIPWDDWFPFRPEWVWIYLLPYLVGPVVMGCIRPETFRWYLWRAYTILGLSLAIFIAVPTRVAARPTTQLDGLTGWLFQNMVAIDEPPANAAPSLHVSLTFLLALALMHDFPRLWPFTFFGVGMVWLATLFTRQHHLIDVTTGILLTGLVVWIWPEKGPKKSVET